MPRSVVAGFFVVALILGLIGLVPTKSVAQVDPATPTQLVVPPCTNEDWLDADVRPADPRQSSVFPAAVASSEVEQRELYLVMVTLPPLPAGQACMPLEAKGNQKDGAVVLIVQEGMVAFTWQPYAEDGTPTVSTGTPPIVKVGHQTTLGQDLAPNVPVLLQKGDWVTLDQQVMATYTNMGDDIAIIWKAVYAIPGGGGCHGDCRG